MSIIDTYVHSDNTEYEIADSATRTRVSAVEGKIPSGASSSNKMATASDITTLQNSMFPRSEQAVLGAKNLLKNLEYSASGDYEINGITYTYDASTGIATANGTASADSQFMYALRTKMNFVLKKGRYILSGCPSGGASNSYRLQGAKNKVYNNPSAGYDSLPLDTGSGATWDLSEDAQIQLSIFIPSGTTVSNLVFKPMIRLASDSDDTYVPYVMTNRELTDKATPKNGEFSSVEGTLSSESYLTKVGNTVFMGYRASGITKASYGTLAVIPSEFRPRTGTVIRGICKIVGADTFYPAQVDAGGLISVNPALSNQEIVINGMSWSVS